MAQFAHVIPAIGNVIFCSGIIEIPLYSVHSEQYYIFYHNEKTFNKKSSFIFNYFKWL